MLGPSAARILDGLASHIEVLLDAQYEQMLLHGWKAVPESPLEKLKARLRRQYGPAGDWDGAEAAVGGAIGTLMLAVSGQHLRAIRALLLAREVVLPIPPLARSVLEATGRTFWLVDPRLDDVRSWAARVWMARLEDVTRRVRTAKSLGVQVELESLVKAKRRMREVDIPARFYVSEIENRAGVITLRKQDVPGLSGSLRYVAAGLGVEDTHSGMYAYLSDATHPTLYAALETLQQPTEREDLHMFGSGDLKREYKIIRNALIAYQQSWLLLTSYYGHDRAAVGEVCERINHLPVPTGL